MAVQAATVGILIEKAKFDPQVALAIAEAIDNEKQGLQVVTVPVLDGRLADLKAHVEVRLADLKGHFDLRLADVDTRLADLKGHVDLRLADVDARLANLKGHVDLRLADVDARLVDLKGHVEVRLADVKAELVRWVFLTTLGQVTMLTGIMYFLLQHSR